VWAAALLREGVVVAAPCCGRNTADIIIHYGCCRSTTRRLLFGRQQ
jgi:hypothetical protein